jgi:hypothetical protein
VVKRFVDTLFSSGKAGEQGATEIRELRPKPFDYRILVSVNAEHLPERQAIRKFFLGEMLEI